MVLYLDALEIVFPSPVHTQCGRVKSRNRLRITRLYQPNEKCPPDECPLPFGQGTNVSKTDRVMSNRHMADAIQLNSGFHHIVLQNAALATVYSEDIWFFWVILCSLAFLIDSCMSSPKNFLCGKLDDSLLCLLCGKLLCVFLWKNHLVVIALLSFVMVFIPMR